MVCGNRIKFIIQSLFFCFMTGRTRYGGSKRYRTEPEIPVPTGVDQKLSEFSFSHTIGASNLIEGWPGLERATASFKLDKIETDPQGRMHFQFASRRYNGIMGMAMLNLYELLAGKAQTLGEKVEESEKYFLRVVVGVDGESGIAKVEGNRARINVNYDPGKSIEALVKEVISHKKPSERKGHINRSFSEQMRLEREQANSRGSRWYAN